MIHPETINGGGMMSGRLPPQAPSSRPPSNSRSRSSSADRVAAAVGGGDSGKSSSSRKSKSSSSGHRSRRGRSSSDGVRMLNERYQKQQQQQQYYYGGYQNSPNNNYPMQYPNNNPPPPYNGGGQSHQHHPRMPLKHAQSERIRGSSFDASNPWGDNSGYGSIPPPPPPPTRSRSGSKEFSAMNEISSVIGRNTNYSQRSPRASAGGGRPSHRRSMSDPVNIARNSNSPTLPPMPGYNNNHHQQGNIVMPNPNYNSRDSSGGSGSRMRSDSYGSQGSYHSQNNNGPPGQSEMDAILARYNQENGGGGGRGYKGVSNSGRRPSSHMRQNSVNLYMESFKGEKQPKSFKDVMWGILFVLQLVVMCMVGLKYGPEALVPTADDLGPGDGLEDDTDLEPLLEGDLNDDDSKIVLAYQNIVKMAYTCGAFAIIISALALAFMMAMSRRLVYVALVLSIGVSFAWGTIGIGISPKSFVPITGIIALMLTVGYMFVVWDRIPFASANLTTALTGVRDNLGLVGVAFLFQFLTLLCSIYYTITFVGLHDAMHNGELKGLSDNMMWGLDILLLVSYYWTYQVLRVSDICALLILYAFMLTNVHSLFDFPTQHIVIVTVAGTIGSWWFCKPSALNETFSRAMLYNFGSICYGSLFVGFVQFLRQITEGMRPNHDDSSLMCLAQCSLFFQDKIVSYVDSLADFFTPWAFTYVGMYHYELKESGHKANYLFNNRGWSRIVTDDLIASVLAMVSLVIGGLCGSFAVILQALDGHGLTSFGHPVLVSFT